MMIAEECFGVYVHVIYKTNNLHRHVPNKNRNVYQIQSLLSKFNFPHPNIKRHFTRISKKTYINHVEIHRNNMYASRNP